MSRQAGSMFGGIQSRAGYPSKRAGSRCGCVLRARPKVKVGGNWRGCPYRHPRSKLVARPPRSFPGYSHRGDSPGRGNGYRIRRAFPFAVCSAADLNISLSLSEQDLTLPGAAVSSKGEVMTNLEEAIRERAYYLWSADGQPEGKADVYWLNAQRDVLTTSLEGPNTASATKAPTDPVSATTKPAKKAKVARSGKGKTRAA